MPPPERPAGKASDKIHALFGQRVDFCAVYAIGSDEKKRPIKIGYAENVERRLRELQIGNPDKLKIIGLAWVMSWKLARRIEKRCHAILDKANKRIDGEWFDIDGEWAKKVIAVAAREEYIPIYSSEAVRATEVNLREFRHQRLIRMADMVLTEHDKGKRGRKSGQAARDKLVRRASKTIQRIEGKQRFRVPDFDLDIESE